MIRLSRIFSLLLLVCVITAGRSEACGNVKLPVISQSDIAAQNVCLNTSFVNTRGFSTGNHLHQSFIFVDKGTGYVYTSLVRLMDYSHHIVKARKIKRFKKGIPAKRIVVSNTKHCTRYLGQDLLKAKSLVTESTDLLVLRGTEDRGFYLHELFRNADPVLNN